ncbi:Pleiotropic drug resistance ABC transporter protein [Mycena venus]|uniref:Pleiotropic drug resistance ABC transporter protein n=1 Tax=Mycena venus TaxID=2733690 RepID=A0A8H7DDZ4_9AGAR|nr:Pleiotropic drug resistance ABC transporter protein [Mycena venus]
MCLLLATPSLLHMNTGPTSDTSWATMPEARTSPALNIMDGALPWTEMSAPFIMDDTLSESEIYSTQILHEKRGFPLYVPGPQETLPQEYQRHGVAIGDVGAITSEGSFDFFFNIFLNADNPINNNDVPDNFCPLPSYESQDLYEDFHEPGSYLSTPSVQRLHSNSLYPEDFFFNCRARQGAVLALPHGSRIQKLRHVESIREYATRHAESWFKYINGPRGRGLDGSVYLVTGWEKAPVWGMATFHSVSHRFQLSFRPSIDASSGIRGYLWRGNPAQKKYYSPPALHSPPWNQTLFIHGLTISLGSGLWGWLFGTVQIGDTIEMESQLGITDINSTTSAQRSLLSWFLGFLGREAKDEKYMKQVVSSDIPHASKILDSKETIHCVHEKTPQAAVIRSCENNCGEDLRDNNPTSPLRTIAELLQTIRDQYRIVEKNVAASTGQELLNPSDIYLSQGKFAAATLSSVLAGFTKQEEYPTFGGGYGDIFRAHYDNKLVALKSMRYSLRDSDLPRIRLKFCREAVVLGRLQHPHIMLFLGIDRGSFFPSDSLCMVSPWMEHGTVTKYLQDLGRTNVDKLLYEIVHGLQYLHSCGIVHGDLQRADILLIDDHSACLADFRLSNFSGNTLPDDNREGNINWMALDPLDPDRSGDKFSGTPAADPYAFACVYLEISTGRYLFSNISDPATLTKILNGECPECHSAPQTMPSLWMEYIPMINYPQGNDRVNLCEIVQGLRYLNSHYIVHSDLRGGHNMINEDWNACLNDFGLGFHILHRSIELDAIHYSGKQFIHQACHSWTRAASWEDLLAWGSDTKSGSAILWLHGVASMGKSAIVKKFADDFNTENRLGASFFFNRGHLYQVAHVVARGKHSQFHSLIVEPSKQLWLKIIQIIELDALDECYNCEIRQDILWLAIGVFEMPIRVLIMSRPGPQTHQVVETKTTLEKCDNMELSLEKMVHEDIRTYLKDKFSKIHLDRAGDVVDGWPPLKVVGQHGKKSSCIFIYATTAVHSVDVVDDDPQEQLASALKRNPENTVPLDDLYYRILAVAVSDSEQNDQQLRMLLESLRVAPETEEIDHLLNLTRGTSCLAWRGLRWLLKMQPIILSADFLADPPQLKGQSALFSSPHFCIIRFLSLQPSTDSDRADCSGVVEPLLKVLSTATASDQMLKSYNHGSRKSSCTSQI